MTSPLWHQRDVVTASGPDAATFLQGQLSQDVVGLAVGASAWSFVLQPTGKVTALVRVLRMASDEFRLDTDVGYGGEVLVRLNRFRLRVKVELTGPETVDAWAGVTAGSVVGWTGELTEAVGGVAPDGAVHDDTEYQRLRIEAGWPAMGAELTEDVIPGETGLVPVTVSFTKGCYTGQELVARIDSRGNNVPRHLRRVRLDAPAEPGARIHVGDKDVGWVTSVLGEAALAYVGRGVEVPADVDLGHVEAIQRGGGS